MELQNGERGCREESRRKLQREKRAELYRGEENRVAEGRVEEISRWKRRHTLHRRVDMEIQEMKAERSREPKLSRTKPVRSLLTIAEYSVSVVLLTETLPCFVSDEDLSLRQSLHFRRKQYTSSSQSFLSIRKQ